MPSAFAVLGECMVGLIGYGDRAKLLSSYTDDVAELDETITEYQTGRCAVLASRIRQLTGWEIQALPGAPDQPMSVHFLNVEPGGDFVDSLGRTPKSWAFMIRAAHGSRDGPWMTRNSLACIEMNDDDIDHVDRFLATPWMQAVVPVALRVCPELPECVEDEDED